MDLNPQNNSSQSAKQNNTQIDGLRKKDQNKEVKKKKRFPFPLAIKKITKKKKWKSRPEYMTM